MAILKDGDERLAPKYRRLNTVQRPDGSLEFYPMFNDRTAGQRVIAHREDPETGEINEVATPNMPYDNWLDPTGGQVAIVYGTNRDSIKGMNAAERQRKRMEKVQKGFVPYDFTLAKQLGQVPMDVTEDQWPDHIKSISVKRRKAHNVKSARAAEVGKSEFQRYMEAQARSQGFTVGKTERRATKGR